MKMVCGCRQLCCINTRCLVNPNTDFNVVFTGQVYKARHSKMVQVNNNPLTAEKLHVKRNTSTMTTNRVMRLRDRMLAIIVFPFF